MESELQYQIEEMIDHKGLTAILRAIEETCYLKAQHVEENWQDGTLARQWTKAGKTLDNVVVRIEEIEKRMTAVNYR